MAGLSSAHGLQGPGEPHAAVVHANEPWYRERREPEQVWRGRLARRRVAAGPGVRTALTFSLETTNGAALPVYAAGVETKLGPFEDQRVVVRGKLVDLGPEGHGTELWIGTLAREGSLGEPPSRR